MKQAAVRTTIDIPEPLYRQLKQQAASRGCSVRELVLTGVRSAVLKEEKPRSRRVKFPLFGSGNRKVPLTNEQIYEYIEFP